MPVLELFNIFRNVLLHRQKAVVRISLYFPNCPFCKFHPHSQLCKCQDDHSLLQLQLTKNLQENEVYDGEENPLVFSRIYALDLHCTFQLQDYPFDDQHCNTVVKFFRKITPYTKNYYL